jgi:hypothetical protein
LDVVGVCFEFALRSAVGMKRLAAQAFLARGDSKT